MTTNTKPKEIPVWAKRDHKKDGENIIFDGRLRRYRADLLGGCFRCSDLEDSAIGSALGMQIIDSRWITESRFGRGNKSHFDIAFIDFQNVASCLSLSRDSAVNVAEWLRNLAIGDAIFPEALVCKLDMERVNTESGVPYHVVFVNGWEFTSESKFGVALRFKSSDRYIANQWQGVY